MNGIKHKVYFYVILLLISACNQNGNDNKKVKSVGNEVIHSSEHKQIEVGKGPDALFLTPDQKKLYVANVGDTTVSIINTEDDTVIKTLNGIPYPWGFERIGSKNLVAVSAYDRQLSLIDFTKDEIVQQKKFSSHLGGITSDSSGKHLFVVAIDSQQVWKVNSENLDVIARYPTGKGPDGVGISGDNRKLYVTNTKDSTISIINMEQNSTSTIYTGGKPELIHPNDDHSILYISNFYKDMVYVLDTRKDSIIHEITGLDGPEETVPVKGKKLYVVNFNLDKVFVYKLPGYEKLDVEYCTGKKPIGLIVLNKKLYVTNYGSNSVSVIFKEERTNE